MACIALLVGAVPAAGQRTGAASPLLPPGHWAVEAAARAEALGLAPGYLPAQRAVPRWAVAAALREAVERARPPEAAIGSSAGGRPESVVRLVEGWWDRFRGEFPELTSEGDARGAAVRLLGGHIGAGMEARRGAAAPGLDEFLPDRTGAAPLEDRTQAVFLTDVGLGFGGWGAIHASTEAGSSESRIVRGEAVLRVGKLRGSIGRAEVGWGVGRGGGVIFGGLVPLDRIDVSTAEPLRLPGWLRHIGPLAFQTFAGPLPDDRHPGSPWLLGLTASARPHTRLTLSIHRGLIAGGDGVDERMGAGEIIEALIGKNVVGVNQIASASFRLRLPTERLIPLSIYCEWGAEDSAGAPFDAPGLVCGGTSPAVAGIPGLALGLEHAQLGTRPVNGPPWYRHHMFPGSWADDGSPLGHPLGGEGRQWLAYGEMSALSGRLEVDASAFRRTRTGENLYLPGREGVSVGVAGAASWRYHPRTELRLAGSREDGDRWAETHIEIMSRIFF